MFLSNLISDCYEGFSAVAHPRKTLVDNFIISLVLLKLSFKSEFAMFISLNVFLIAISIT